MAVQSSLPMVPISSPMAGGLCSQAVHICCEDTSPKYKAKQTKIKASFFKRKSRKAAPVPKNVHPEPKPEPSREDTISTQVERIGTKLFVSSSCLCCPSQSQHIEPRLCLNRTYNCFTPN